MEVAVGLEPTKTGLAGQRLGGGAPVLLFVLEALS
jgi:hypothetical protein